jgi:hypothetical protein
MAHRIARQDSARAFERIKLLSTVPLNTGREATAPLPLAAIDTVWTPCAETLSVITRNITTVTAIEIRQRRLRHADFIPPAFEHHVSPMGGRRRRKKRQTPAPGTYEPENQSRPQQTTLPRRDSEQTKRPFTPVSALDVVHLWENRMRDFDAAEVQTPDPIIGETEKNRDLTPSSCFRSGSSREVFRNPSAAKDLDPGDLRRDKPPNVPEMAKQRNRVIPVKEDSGRDYEEAVPQLMKAKSRIANPATFEHQTARDPPQHKNERVQKLEGLASEHHRFIEELSVRGSPRVQSSRREKKENAFDCQKKRSEKVFPAQRELTGESQWPSDPIESQKKTQSRVRVPVFRSTGRALEGEEFWQAKRGNRESVLDLRTNSRID